MKCLPVFKADLTDPSLDVDVRFTLINRGDTVAVVHSLDARMYCSPFMIEPDPGSEMGQITQGHTVRVFNESDKIHMPGPQLEWMLPVPITQFANIEARFIFARPIVAKDNQLGIAGSGLWFYCLVSYRDVYDIDRETSMYVMFRGAPAISDHGPKPAATATEPNATSAAG